MTADLKTFKLKARGDAGSGKTQLLIVTSTKEQRSKLYQANRGRS